MKREIAIAVAAAIAAGILVRECAPPKVIEREIPRIVTVYDTVPFVPHWLTDSIRQWKRVVHTTDTVNVIITNTIVDTTFIPVDRQPEERPDLWPVLGYTSGGGFGDTAFVRTFSLRSGALSVSRVFTAGILTAIEVDSGSSIPKITYKAFPQTRTGASLWDKIKYTALGASGASLVCLLRP